MIGRNLGLWGGVGLLNSRFARARGPRGKGKGDEGSGGNLLILVGVSIYTPEAVKWSKQWMRLGFGFFHPGRCLCFASEGA